MVAVGAEEAILDLDVAAQEAREQLVAVAAQALEVAVRELGDGLGDGAEGLALVGVVDRGRVALENVEHRLAREREGAAAVRGAERREARVVVAQHALEIVLDRLGQTTRDVRERVLELEQRQMRVGQDRHHALHEAANIRAAVADHHPLQLVNVRVQLLVHLLVERTRRQHLGQVAVELVGLLDRRRIVEVELGDQIAGRQERALGLDVVHDAGLGAHDRHVHLHDLDLGERRALVNVRAVLHQVAHQLAGRHGQDARRIVLVRKAHGLAADGQAQARRLLGRVDDAVLAVDHHQEAAVGQLAALDVHRAVTERHRERVRCSLRYRRVVLDVLVDERDLVAHLQQRHRRHLATLEVLQKRVLALLRRQERLHQRATHHHQHGVQLLSVGLQVSRLYQLIEPARMDRVALERIQLHQLGNVLDRCTNIASNRQLSQGQDHVPTSFFAL